MKNIFHQKFSELKGMGKRLMEGIIFIHTVKRNQAAENR